MAQTTASTPVALKSILVATDYSPDSVRAFSFAAALAARFAGRIYALHAGEPVNYAVPPQLWKEAVELAQREAVELGRVLHRDFPQIESEVLQEEGPVWQAVNRVVALRKADLVVLSTHGRKGMAKFLLGSVAEDILRRAICPVLCLGPLAQPWEEVPLAGSEMVFATDFSPESYHAAPQAFAWAAEWNARLRLLHVLEDDARLNFARPLEPADAARRSLERMLPDGSDSAHFCQLQVSRGEPAEKIVETAESLRAPLVILGVRQPEGFPGAATHLAGSTLHKVISRAPCAVLCAR